MILKSSYILLNTLPLNPVYNILLSEPNPTFILHPLKSASFTKIVDSQLTIQLLQVVCLSDYLFLDRWFPFLLSRACCEACGNLKAAFLIAVVSYQYAQKCTYLRSHLLQFESC